MSVPVPNYYEFDSINPNYHPNPNTKENLTLLWKSLSSRETIARCTPEGLLVDDGVSGIQRRLAEIRYLVVVPRELAEELRLIIIARGMRGGFHRGRHRDNEVRVEPEPHPMKECPPPPDDVHDENGEDPFPDIPCPWPLQEGEFSDAERSISGRLAHNIIGRATYFETRQIRYIFTYDYCGQYYGSAEGFCSYMNSIEGHNAYSATLEELKASVESNGDAPLIVLCPENIEAFLSRLRVPSSLYGAQQPSPDERYRFGLMKVFVHEIGHHMFPVTDHDFEDNGTMWAECMANWFAYHFLNDKERFILHMWSLRQPVEYQCYKALLGLSMRDNAKEFLSIIPYEHRSNMLVDVERICSLRFDDSLHHITPRGYLYLDPYFFNVLDLRSFIKRIMKCARTSSQPVLLTHAEVLFQHLIDNGQYNKLFYEYRHMISRGVVMARMATKGEYHRMLLEESKQMPLSIGHFRRLM